MFDLILRKNKPEIDLSFNEFEIFQPLIWLSKYAK